MTTFFIIFCALTFATFGLAHTSHHIQLLRAPHFKRASHNITGKCQRQRSRPSSTILVVPSATTSRISGGQSTAPAEVSAASSTRAVHNAHSSAAVPPPSQPPTNNGGGGTSNAYTRAHNSFRQKYHAGSLTWDSNLAAKAQQWANKCKFEHSGGSLGPYGENLAAGTGDGFGVSQAIKMWTDESSGYDPNNPTYSHFTQVVWKGTKKLGCAVANCDGIFDASYGKAHFYVCEYYPAGNVIGQFAQNVQV